MGGGLITAVAAGSLAERADVRAGDELLSVGGQAVRDVIDVQILAADERVVFEVRRGEERFSVEAARRYGEPLGLTFAEPTFDGVQRCNNRCAFCFVSQMRPGLRPSLYVKDDDYRLSFLTGSYVTLTNLDEADWARIGEQRLSPLYVSVHASDPELRRRLLRHPGAPDVMEQLRRLAGMDVEVHAQIVVVPGLNDGPHLERTIGDLAGLYPALCSVSVVPVGLTRFHRGGCRIHTDAEMRVVFKQVGSWEKRLRDRLGVGFVYLSDEWMLRLGEAIPALERYDGLDLAENGVGLVRQFLEARGWEAGDGSWMPGSRLFAPRSVTLVTGTLFAPILREVVAGLPHVEVVPVLNRFFGETVTVAGLLAAQDVVAQLRERELGEVVVLPPAVFGGPEGQSLDGMQPWELAEALGREVSAGVGTRSREGERSVSFVQRGGSVDAPA